MKRAGIREARQNISELIETVRKGREVLITDRGRPVARLVPVEKFNARAFPGRAAFRNSMPTLRPPLSSTINEDREDRI
jgi:prevent-host-death family protein